MRYLYSIISLCSLFFVSSCDENEKRIDNGPKNLTLREISVDGLSAGVRYAGTSVSPQIKLVFSDIIDEKTLSENIVISTPTGSIPLNYELVKEDSAVVVTVAQPLQYLSKYNLFIAPELRSLSNRSLGSSTIISLTTTFNPADKFPRISQTALLDSVQKRTFKYFYNFAHPASGMARERNSSGDLVTSGGSGFGIMALVVGMERNYITRTQGVERLDRILDFLEKADRFHGVWAHWMNGNTGKVIPFSANDNGGDLVETSFLIQGLLTIRQYLNPANAEELELINRINTLWRAVEWNWYTRENQNVLYWHWSPDKGWAMNMQIKGYNESLITYVLAASSPTHSVAAPVYHSGWANSGGIRNGKTFFNIALPLGYDFGGPLFFAHYSFLGLDPRNLSDTYANYWTQNVNHSKIHHAYSIANPRKFVGYSDENWGLTASDNHQGYSAHSPTNDLGVISPTAALSSFPYTPVESMKALEFFYYKLGDRLWGPYGFYDAFNLTEGWVANSYLAIDQGPIVVMIENHRTGLLWDLFMTAPEVKAGLTKLSFSF